MAEGRFDRIGLVVHPRRNLDRALETIGDWAQANGAEVVQVGTPGQEREVAPAGDVAACDLVIALGGDGTALAALRAAAPSHRPVLGVACGSLGALTGTTAEKLEYALGRVAGGAWRPRRLPALAADRGRETLRAINDLVLVRASAGQVTVEILLDGERYARFAGDGLVAATPLGSTAYTLAAGGPMLAPGSRGLVLTPLSPHGGFCPPVVTVPRHDVHVTIEPGHGGARVELDGQIHTVLERMQTVSLSLRFENEFATLVSFGEEEPMLPGLRRRGIIVDSPRVRAREKRAPAAPY
jgi:NAD+ kinase